MRERLFRRALWAAGVRGYRVEPKLPGRPDLAFPALKLAVFVHGCYWHRCDDCRLPMPKANADFWRAKLDENRSRDDRDRARLTALGWETLTIWEHEIRPDPVPRARMLAADIAQRRRSGAGRSDG